MGYKGWAGSSQITQATPVADPGRRFVYAVSPNGRVHKLAVANGREAAGLPVAVTRDPSHEKIAPALNFSRGLVLVATGGYIGDAPPYQGHVVAIDARRGRIVSVWNSLCSDRTGVIKPSSCEESGSAIWARQDQADLEAGDVDLGSTAPALVGSRLAVQSGKDAKLRLLDLRRLNGHGGADPTTGGELQTVRLDGGLFSAPAVWRSAGRTWIFVSTDGGTRAFQLRTQRLQPVWKSTRGSTSPVVSGGLLYVYDADLGGLSVLRPTTGQLVAKLPAGPGHWNSPIVTDGRIALPEGSANDHGERGVLDIYRL